MIFEIIIGTASIISSFAAAKYAHDLREKSEKSTVVIVKNLEDVGKGLKQNVISRRTVESKCAPTPNTPGPIRQYISIPIPFPDEVRSFIVFLSALPFFCMLIVGIACVIILEPPPQILHPSLWYVGISCLLWILHKHLFTNEHYDTADAFRFIVLAVSGIYSVFVITTYGQDYFGLSKLQAWTECAVTSAIFGLAYYILQTKRPSIIEQLDNER